MWTLGYVLGGVVVLLVAVLLLAILLVARNIERLAGQALTVAGEIRAATRPIWSLGDVNDIVEEIAGTVRAIEDNVAVLAEELSTPSEGGAP